MVQLWKKRLSAILSAIMLVSLLAGTGIVGTQTASAAALPSLKFDFGSETSPVAPGYNQVTNKMIYSTARGYGLNISTDFRDRGGSDPLLRDFVINSNFLFMVDLPNGEYSVKIVAGDAIASNKTDVRIEGVSYGTISSGSGLFSELTKTVRLEDGQMTFQFTNNGRVNAIEIYPLTYPSGLTVSEMTYAPAASVSLVWEAVYGALGYNIYRTGAGDGNFSLIGSSAAPGFKDTTVSLTETYQYKVSQLTAQNYESASSPPITVSVVDPATPPPAAPAELYVKSSAKEQITIGWSPSASALWYNVYRSKSPSGPFIQVGSSASTEFTDTDVFTTIPYYYQVVAVNAGGKSNPSAVLNVPAATVLYRQAETLDRSPVAVLSDGGIYIGWRLLGTDPEHISFHLYRDGQRINSAPIATSTNYLDPEGTVDSTYEVRAVIGGIEEQSSEAFPVWRDPYKSVPLQKPADGVINGAAYTYSANDTSVGDLDGDGKYELIVKWDPSNSKDNSQSGYTGNVFIDAYRLDGTLLWRIDLGRNIRAGAHYTQFMVYDLDGDGKAEVAFKTADGTVDGTGQVIGSPNADYRNSSGYILSGPEYLTVFEGTTGKALATTNYDPPRGNVSSWGDSYGNRVDRFLAGVAYLDGERPSLIFSRGYYTRTVVVAYNWRDGQLSKQWTFDTNTPGYGDYAGEGNHQLSIADVDKDGKDEIIFGAMVLDDNGKPLYRTGLGHGDALHAGDLDPSNPGLEVFSVHEHYPSSAGIELRNAETGELLWGIPTNYDVGRGMSGDIDPRYHGEEMWASGESGGVYTAKGQRISTRTPSINFGIWWDGDLLRELLDHNYSSTAGAGTGKIDKWDYMNSRAVNLLTATGTYSNNTTKGTPNLQADLFGDWREEAVWRTEDSSALHIYTTSEMTQHRLYTLMDDPQYRLSIAWQNVGYNQPPHPSFYLGDGMSAPPVPKLKRTPVRVSGIEVTGVGKADGLFVSESLQMVASVFPAAATDKSVIWTVTSEDGGPTANALINTSGELRGLAEGNVLVTATAADGSGASGSTRVRIRSTTIEGNTIHQYSLPEKDGKVIADVKTKDLQEAANAASDQKVRVTLHSQADYTSAQINLPASFVFSAESQGLQRLEMDTGILRAFIDPNLFKRHNLDRTSVQVEISSRLVDVTQLSANDRQKADGKPVYAFTLSIDGKEIRGFGDDVRLSVPYSGGNTNPIVIYMLDDNGHMYTVNNGSYDPDTGTVIFKANR